MASKKPGITLEDEAKSDSRIFQLDYELQEEIQSGSYGTVYVTRHRGNEEKYAVKVIDRSKLKKNDDNNTLREINICLLYTSPSPRDRQKSRMPSSA